MGAKLGRVCLAAMTVAALSGAAVAREAPMRGFKGKAFPTPAYRADARVSGPEQPFTWPVADRYRPVSKPFYGRAF